ncbi:MAG: protein translocase subunit SecF [Bacillota bacterium]|nr:protein translocase subunit SecF [Bacillota bacterium]
MKIYNITKHLPWYISAAGLVVVLGVVFAFVWGGLNIGIDFTGGTIMTLDLHKEYSVDDVRQALINNGVGDAPVVKSGAEGASTQAIIRLKEKGTFTEQEELRAKIRDDLKAKYPDVEIAGVDRVGGVASTDLLKNASIAVAIALTGILLYTALRFKLIAGVATIIAMIHDVLLMTAVVAIFQIQINSPYIAAVLTIMGYSIYDTIVVFDRIRENEPRYFPKQMDRFQLTNLSIRETLVRSIVTTMVTLFTIVALCIFGVISMQEFAIPLAVGIASGAYSSIFIATPIWAYWKTASDLRKGIVYKDGKQIPQPKPRKA